MFVSNSTTRSKTVNPCVQTGDYFQYTSIHPILSVTECKAPLPFVNLNGINLQNFAIHFVQNISLYDNLCNIFPECMRIT